MAGPATPDLAGIVNLVGRLMEAIARADATAVDVARAAGTTSATTARRSP